MIVLVNCVVVRLFLYEKMDGSSVVSFRVKGDSDSVFDEEQWQETVLIGDDDKVQVNQVKEDGLSKKVAEIQIKKDIDSENVAPLELDFAETKFQDF